MDHLNRPVGPQLEASLGRLGLPEVDLLVLTADPDVALLGLSFENEQDAAFSAAEAFRPMGPAEMAETRRRAVRAMEGKGEVWWDPH